MVKHIQTIGRLLPTIGLSVLDHFAGLAFKGLTSLLSLFLFLFLQQNLHVEICKYQTLFFIISIETYLNQKLIF